MAIVRAGFLECAPHGATLGVAVGEACRWRWEELVTQSAGAGAEADPARLLAGLAGRTRFRGLLTLLVPAALLLVKPVRVPAVAGRRRAQVLRFEAVQAIPYALDEVVWGCVRAHGDATGEQQLLFAVKQVAVERWCAAAESAGFAVAGAWPAPLATLAAFRSAGPAAGAHLVLAPGDGAHELWQVDGERLALRLLVANDEPPDLTNLAGEIRRTRAHFRTIFGLDAAAPSGLWLAGREMPPAFADGLSTWLQLPVRMLGARTDAVPESAGVRAEASIQLQGAAEMAFDPRSPRVDLLPRLRCEARRWRRQAPWFAAAAVLAVAALLPPVIGQRVAAMRLRERLAALEAELAPQRARAAEFRAQEARVAGLAADVEQLGWITAQRRSWLAIMADLQERLGRVEDVWLDRFELVPPSGEAGPRPALRFAVSGRMLDRAKPPGQVSPETYGRVKALLGSLAGSSHVAAVERERFDSVQAGILGFECELVVAAERPW